MKQFVKPVLFPKVLSTCRHLLLFMDNWNFFLCNYATQESIALPNIASGMSFGRVGFGYVPSTKEFKVLAEVWFGGYKRWDYNILTVGTDHWRYVEPPPFSIVPHQSAFINGHIHILSGIGSETKIASFNLEREEWGALAAPSNYNGVRHSIKELSGYLCLLVWQFGTNDLKTMDIWLLKDYDNGSWVKEYTICISTLKAKIPSDVTPLAIEEGGRLLLKVDYSLQLYDPKSKRSREIHRFEELDRTTSFYVKCFSSLRHPFPVVVDAKLSFKHKMLRAFSKKKQWLRFKMGYYNANGGGGGRHEGGSGGGGYSRGGGGSGSEGI